MTICNEQIKVDIRRRRRLLLPSSPKIGQQNEKTIVKRRRVIRRKISSPKTTPTSTSTPTTNRQTLSKLAIIRDWIFFRRQADKNENKFDSDSFIDSDFLQGLFEDNKYCYYKDCNTKLQYTTHGPDFPALHRLNNTIGHIKSNCILCCVKCHYRKKNLATRY